jgi:hypothetical protein
MTFSITEHDHVGSPYNWLYRLRCGRGAAADPTNDLIFVGMIQRMGDTGGDPLGGDGAHADRPSGATRRSGCAAG